MNNNIANDQQLRAQLHIHCTDDKCSFSAEKNFCLPKKSYFEFYQTMQVVFIENPQYTVRKILYRWLLLFTEKRNSLCYLTISIYFRWRRLGQDPSTWCKLLLPLESLCSVAVFTWQLCCGVKPCLSCDNMTGVINKELSQFNVISMNVENFQTFPQTVSI